MRGLQRHMRNAGDTCQQMIAMPLERRRGVAGSGNDQRRAGDAADPVRQFHVPDRRAAAGIAFRVHRQQLATHRFINGGFGGIGQETAHGEIGNGCHPLVPDLDDAIVP